MSITTIEQRDHELRAYINGFLSDPAHDDQSANSLLAEVFRRAAASMNAEPVAIYRHDGTVMTRGSFGFDAEPDKLIKLYAAPPAQGVPAELRKLLGTLFNSDGRRGADFDLFDYLKTRDDIVAFLQRNE